MISKEDNIVDYGLWANKVFTEDFVNMTGIEVARDQFIQLYMMMYPFISAEFAHREDVSNWAIKQLEEQTTEIDRLRKEIEQLKEEIQRHVHMGNMGSPTGPSIETTMQPITYTLPDPQQWKTLPEDADYKFGEEQVTEDSTYTKGLKHKHPTEGSKNYSPEIDIVGEFNEANKFVPIDVEPNNIDTGDSNFINQGV